MFDYKKCATCKYSGKLNENEICCLYILKEGHMRDCYEGDKCDKYTKRTKKCRTRIDLEGGFYVYED